MRLMISVLCIFPARCSLRLVQETKELLPVFEAEPTPSMRIPVSPGLFITGYSRELRPIEEYDYSVYPPDVAERLKHQIIQDRQYDVFTPDLGTSNSEESPIGDLTFQQIVYRGRYTIIFSVLENPKIFIKYQANCDEIGRANDTNTPLVHPLLTDHWFSTDAGKHGLSVRTLFVSPPALMCRRQRGKCYFDGEHDIYDACFKSWGTLRYMIMEKSPGLDLFDIRAGFAQGVVPFHTAMSIGAVLIENLRRLHEDAKVVHGDIHCGNIMLEPDLSHQNIKVLKFIDFARSFQAYEPGAWPANVVHEREYYDHFYYTHWQAEGYAWSFRDDVMKAIQVIATIMNTYEYTEFEESIMKEGFESQQEYKRTAYLFEIPNHFSPIESLPVSDETKIRIRTLLVHVLELVRSLDDINDPPPYAEIVYAFSESERLATS
jgi:hypothetical protein